MIRYLRTASKKKLQGTALLRLDFNAADDMRIKAALPTIRFLLKNGARIVMFGHKGRPSGVRIVGGVPRGGDAQKLSLRRESIRIAKLVGKPVVFIPNFSFSEIQGMVSHAPARSLFLLENTRFLAGEDKNTKELARAFASLGDYYVNDAFSASHRKAASIVAIAELLPGYAGFGFEGEVKTLSRILVQQRRPFVVVVGGAKIGDKLGMLARFKSRADYFLIGGGTANPLLAIAGVDIGRSLTETDPALLRKIRLLMRSKRCRIPIDWRVERGRIVDIGPATETYFGEIIRRARTVIWNGPMGLIEVRKFMHGTLAVARAIAHNKNALSIAGGGETAAFLKQNNLDQAFSFVSTGGGAMLEFLAGKKLPGIEALEKRNKYEARNPKSGTNPK